MERDAEFRGSEGDRPTPYTYIKRAYGKDFTVGDRVFHTETKKFGTVVEPSGHEHYVHVLFPQHDGPAHCHPLSLEKR